LSPTASHKSLLDTGRFFHSTEGSRLIAQAVFLDRDGVLIADEGHLTNAASMKFLPGVQGALTRLRDDFYLIVITNQSCISRGLLSEDGLRKIHIELCDRLAAYGVNLDGIYYCPHHPREGDGPYRIECQCRKPQPGMLLQASADWNIDMNRSFMVGDSLTDAGAAQAAGVAAVLVGKSGQGAPESIVTATDLATAAGHIMSQSDPAGASISGGSK